MSKYSELKNLQSIFIDAEEWDEVSRLQHQMDSLPSEEPREDKLKPWFINCLNWYCLQELKKRIDKDMIKLVYLEKKERRYNNDKLGRV